MVIDRTPIELPRWHGVSIPYLFSLKEHPKETVVTINCYISVKLKNGFETTSQGFDLIIHPDSPTESDAPVPPPSS